MADKAIAAVKKYPVVDFALKGFGVNVDKIKSELFGSSSSREHSAPMKGSNPSSYRDRLNKLG